MDKSTFYLLLLTAFCGKDVSCEISEHKQSVGKIVGGEETMIERYPHQVHLQLHNGSAEYQCGGSIIDQNFIITSARCIENVRSIVVRIGSTQSNSGGTTYTPSIFHIHPLYDDDTYDYDIGLIEVSGRGMALDGTDAREIEMVGYNFDVEEGDNVTITGWGATSEDEPTTTTLNVVTVPAVDRANCDELLGEITERMFCAGLLEGGKGFCEGDIGGPAVVNERLAGVMSQGSGCARPDSPGVYTRIGEREIRSYIRGITGR